MRILGIDFGLKKIGLAMSDSDVVIPLKVIRWPRKASLAQKSLVPGQLIYEQVMINKIFRICLENEIEKVVMGLPEGEIAKKAKLFGKKLADFTGLPVIYQDETLTSQEAIDRMIEVGKGKKARQLREDAIAAALILENYLENQKIKEI